MKIIIAIVVGLLVFGQPGVCLAKDRTKKEERAKSSGRIEKGKKVTLKYSLTVDGKVIDASTPEKPFQYVAGNKQIIKGLEAALMGMKVGDSKKVTAEPKDAYGEVNPNAFVKFPKSKIPAGTDIKKGQIIGLINDKKQSVKGIVWDLKDDDVILNMNHPLAGKTLNFDVKVISVE